MATSSGQLTASHCPLPVPLAYRQCLLCPGRNSTPIECERDAEIIPASAFWDRQSDDVRIWLSSPIDKLHSLTAGLAWLDVWSKLLFDKNLKLAELDRAIYGYRSS